MSDTDFGSSGERWERRQPEGIGGYSSLARYRMGFNDAIEGRPENPKDYTPEYTEGYAAGIEHVRDMHLHRVFERLSR